MPSRGGRTPESHDTNDLHFHYNREEREALLSEETKRVLKKTKLFTINRRNLIILADIAIIVLFTMIFAPLALGGRNNISFEGFKTELRAYEFDGNILVSLKVGAKEDNPLESGIVKVVFTVEGMEEEKEAVDILPAGVEDPRILRAEFSASVEDRVKVFASVEINGKSRNLSTTAKAE